MLKVLSDFSLPLILIVKCERRIINSRGKKKKNLNERESELKTLGNSQPIHIAKNEKLCSGKNTKGVAVQSFNTEIMDLISYLSRNQEQRWDYTRTRGNTAGWDERGQR